MRKMQGCLTPNLQETPPGHVADLSANMFHREWSGKNNLKCEMITREVRNFDSLFVKASPEERAPGLCPEL